MTLTRTQQRLSELGKRKELYAQQVYHFFYEKTGVEVKGKVKRFINRYFVGNYQFIHDAEITGKLYVEFSERQSKLLSVKFPSQLAPFFEVASRNIFDDPLSYKLK